MAAGRVLASPGSGVLQLEAGQWELWPGRTGGTLGPAPMTETELGPAAGL